MLLVAVSRSSKSEFTWRPPHEMIDVLIRQYTSYHTPDDSDRLMTQYFLDYLRDVQGCTGRLMGAYAVHRLKGACSHRSSTTYAIQNCTQNLCALSYIVSTPARK